MVLPAQIGLKPHPRIITPCPNPTMMTIHAHQLNYKIHILNTHALNDTPARQVYRTVSGILCLVKVRPAFPRSFVAPDLII